MKDTYTVIQKICMKNKSIFYTLYIIKNTYNMLKYIVFVDIYNVTKFFNRYNI